MLDAFFRFIIARRYWVVGVYLLLLGPSVYFALKVPQDNSIHRLIVQNDPDYLAAQRFDKVFGGGEYVVLVLEAPDPFAPEALARVTQLEQALAQVPKVSANSILSIYRQAEPRFQPTAEYAGPLKAFASGTELFRRQGLIGPGFLTLALVLDVHSTQERGAVLAAIDGTISRVLGPVEKGPPPPFTALRRVGQPYVNDYLDRDTRQTGMRYFPLFGLFVLVLNLVLYRSLRALVAFLIPLGLSAAFTVGFVGLTGGVFTIVSSVVPMTILIVCTATLVYLHSRYVDRTGSAEGESDEDHLVFALRNKFLACSASIFATVAGFAALAVSKIRPIREMGLWVSMGLFLTWIIVFTLYPALVRLFKAPTQPQKHADSDAFLRFVDFLPLFSYRFRWVLVPASLVLCVLGAISLFGLPGVIKPMKLQTNAIEYINHESTLYKDTKRMEQIIAGLSITEVWLQGKEVGALARPQVLRGLDRFYRDLESDKLIGSVVGLPTILRTLRYVSKKGDQLPTDEEALEQVLDNMEIQLPRQPMLQRFVNGANLSQTHFSVVTKTVDYETFRAVRAVIDGAWQRAQAAEPALKGFSLETAGLAPLEAKISYHLVPTLVESFWLTVVIIFGTFLVVFRNGAARLMAMIPSLFAILVMFGFMRILGMSLNVATILIASTVLGTSENDQIHFFYHFQEGRAKGTTEQALRHTLQIAGRAIFFATLINAGGFLAFALADLPPIRQFGVLSALAFVLSMLADFTALPAALWLVFRKKPDPRP